MKNRRGLSSVVGTVFAIIALATVITYVTYSMDTLELFNNEVMVKNTELIDQSKEEFDVSTAEIVSSKFNITVQNTGTLPIKITRLYIENKTDGGAYKYDINKDVSTSALATNIGQNIGFIVDDTKSYKIKLVTERGNAKELLMSSADAEPVNLQLFVLPDSVPNDFTTTVLLAVTNNMSSKTTLLNIVPTLDYSVGDMDVNLENNGPDPPKYSSLASGDTAHFKWIFRVSGVDGETKTFTASLQNGFPGNTVSATATLKDITFSLESGTALEAQGLSTSLLPNNLLLLNQETQDAASGRQMYSGGADNPTILNFSQTQTFTFFTKNDTLSDIDVEAGKWNATLRMISKAVPDSIATPSLIYHFESETSTTTPDSSGNAKDMTLGAGGAKPTRGATSGVNSTGGYTFDGGDYMEGPSVTSGIDDIAGPPDTTAGWFKATSTSSAKKVIYRIGSGTSEWYEIVMGDGSNAANAGKIYFQYSTTTGNGQPQGQCITSSQYNDGNWHYFTAVRNGDYTCVLYIDGNQAGVDTTNTCPSCSGINLNIVQPAGKTTIGRNPQNSADYFIGDLDQIFHWNSAQLTQTQAQTMKNTNYGANAHKFDFKLERTNSAGTIVYETIKSNSGYFIPFWDGKGSTGNAAYSALQRNYTTGNLGTFKFSTSSTPPLFHDTVYGDRLKFTITRNAVTSLNMTIKIDEPAMTNPVSSFLQTARTDEPWPSYYVYKISGTPPQVYVYNAGPYASWITFLTRLTWDDISSTNSWGSFVTDGCGTPLNVNTGNLRQDSPLIKVGDQCLVKFSKPSNPPSSDGTGGTVITPGQYRVNVFMSGYDDTGKIFLRTTYVGVIRVIP